MKIISATITNITHFNQVITLFLKDITQSRIGLRAGGIITMALRQLSHSLRINQVNLWINGAAQPSAQYFEADFLPSFNTDFVIVIRFCIDLARYHTWQCYHLRRHLVFVRIDFQNFRKIINTKYACVGNTLGSSDTNGVKSQSCIGINFKFHCKLGCIFTIVVLGRNRGFAREGRKKLNRASKIGACKIQRNRTTALCTSREDWL